jgi:WD40 repeat protein
VADCVGHPVTCVSYTNDGNCVLATCMDSKVRLFDKASGELLASYAGHKNSSYRVESCMTHGDAHVACGSEDGDVFFWDLVSGKQARPTRPWARCAAACACAPHAAAVLRPRRLTLARVRRCTSCLGTKASCAAWRTTPPRHCSSPRPSTALLACGGSAQMRAVVYSYVLT